MGSRNAHALRATFPRPAGRYALALLTGVLLLGACSPELNWREIRPADAGFVVILPGKPDHETRPLAGEEGALMQMWTVKAGGAVFGAGYVQYTKLRADQVQRTRDALAANVKGRVVEEKAFTQRDLAGSEIRVEGGEVMLAARLLPSGDRLYQIALVARKEAIGPSDIELFLHSLQVTPQPPD